MKELLRKMFGAAAISLVAFFFVLAPLRLSGGLWPPQTSVQTARAQGIGSDAVAQAQATQAAQATEAAQLAGSSLGTNNAASPSTQSTFGNFPVGQQTNPSGNGTGGDQTNANGDFACGINQHFSICLSQIVYAVTVGIASPFAYIGSSFLTIAVKLALDSTIYAASFVATGWTVARDMANLAFLFVLIYLSFVIMLKAETGKELQTLGTVIVIALVVNFSFLATRLIVDAGNILAVEIYNAIPADPNQCGGPSYSNSSTGLAAAANPACLTGGKDLTASIMGALGVQSLLNSASFGDFIQSQNNSGMETFITLSILFIATAIILVILGFAFLTAGAQFLARIVALWFAIMISPLAFVCWAIPSSKTRSLYGKWQDMLLRNAFYPAVFLFVFLFLVLFMKAMAAGGAGGGSAILTTFFGTSLSAISASSSGFVYKLATQVALMCIELAFIILMIKTALDASASFAGGSAKFARNFSGNVGGWLYNRVGPGQAVRIAEAGYKRIPGANTMLGTKLRQYTLGQVSGRSPYAAGKAESPAQFGARGATEAKARADTRAQVAARQRDAANKRLIGGVVSKLHADPAGGTLTPEEQQRIKTLNSRELGARNAGELKALAGLLTKSQIDAIDKIEGKFTDADKTDIRTKWNQEAKGAPHQQANDAAAKLRNNNLGIANLDALVALQGAGGAPNIADANKVRIALEDLTHALADTEANKSEYYSNISALATAKAVAPVAQQPVFQQRIDDQIRLLRDANRKLVDINKAIGLVNKFEEARKETPAQVHSPVTKAGEVLLR